MGKSTPTSTTICVLGKTLIICATVYLIAMHVAESVERQHQVCHAEHFKLSTVAAEKYNEATLKYWKWLEEKELQPVPDPAVSKLVDPFVEQIPRSATMPEKWPHSSGKEFTPYIYSTPPSDPTTYVDPNKPGRAYVAPNQPLGISPWSSPEAFGGGHSKPQSRKAPKGQWEPTVPRSFAPQTKPQFRRLPDPDPPKKKNGVIEAIRRGDKVAGI